ncbi:MAG TPA: hypothetical protein VF426_11505 [Marmoricola sp.]
MSMRCQRRAAAVIAIGFLLAGALTACGTSAQQSPWPRLVTPGSGSGGVAAPTARPGVAYSFGAMQVCIGGPRGGVRIESVRPVAARGGLHVTAYGVWRPGTSTLGAAKVRLSSLKGFDATREPTARCSEHRFDTIAVQVEKSTGGAASATGFEVTYSSGGTMHSMRLPLGVALCARSSTRRTCRPPVP